MKARNERSDGIRDDIKESTDNTITKQNFLKISFWSLVATTTAAIGGVGARFLAGNALKPRKKNEVEVGLIAELQKGKMHKLNYSFRARDAWRETQQTGTIFAYTTDGINFEVLDGRCSHLGCIVKWKEAENRFACPCHQGYFTREGQVISGPPPKAMRKLDAQIQNGMLLVKI